MIENRNRVELSFTNNDTLEEKQYKPGSKYKKNNNAFMYLGFLGSIGFAIVIPIALGTYAGHQYDQKFQTGTKGTLIGIGIGFFISIFTLISTVLTFLKMAKE